MTLSTLASEIRDEYPDLEVEYSVEEKTIYPKETLRDRLPFIETEEKEPTEVEIERIKITPNQTIYTYKELAKLAVQHNAKIVTPWQENKIIIREQNNPLDQNTSDEKEDEGEDKWYNIDMGADSIKQRINNLRD